MEDDSDPKIRLKKMLDCPVAHVEKNITVGTYEFRGTRSRRYGLQLCQQVCQMTVYSLRW